MAAINPVQSTRSSELANFLEIEEHSQLPKVLAAIVADYVANTNFFGAAEWKCHFGVGVSEEPVLSKDFYTWWLSPDAFDKEKLNCETHLPPVLRPRLIIKELKWIPCNLVTLKSLAPSKSIWISIQDDVSRLYAQAEVGETRWISMRKEVFRRNEEREKLHIEGENYEELPSAIDLATIVFATYVHTGDRYLGDASGKEGHMTKSFCKEDCWPMEGYDVAVQVGNFSSDTLRIGILYGYSSKECGIAAVRQF